MRGDAVRTAVLLVLAGTVSTGSVGGQQHEIRALPPEEVPLADLGAFASPPSNWSIVGDVMVPPERPEELASTAGRGVLVNTQALGGNLFTRWEHGDLELELEFMLPRGSNSGVYLQGRYEIQLRDSWGERNPGAGSAGGIYQRWDPGRGEGREGFEGHPPLVNASLAPGLWQRLRIVFHAPRFDPAGRKVENARFVRVQLNGVTVHENVEVTGPTRAAAFEDERPVGPLMLQGDHQAVAFRNVRFKRYGPERVRLSELRSAMAEGEFATATDPGIEDLRPSRAAADIAAPPGAPGKFAAGFEGLLHVPVSGRYLFDLRLGWIDNDPHFTGRVLGGGRLSIGGREVLLHEGGGPSGAAEVELKAGAHPFGLAYFTARGGTAPVELFVEGPGIARHPLHDPQVVPIPDPPGAILVEVGGKPVVLRSFARHGAGIRTHAVFVGDPSQVHYGYDLDRGALLEAWRGPFVETTGMWHTRGFEQIAVPRGAVRTFPGAPPVATLRDRQTPWPEGDDDAEGEYRPEGYTLDREGRPTFLYRTRGVAVEDRLSPAADGASLQRTLRLEGAPSGGDLYVRIAAGETIRRRPDGSFLVQSPDHFVVLEGGQADPMLRKVAGGEELLLPVQLDGGAASVSYRIVW